MKIAVKGTELLYEVFNVGKIINKDEGDLNGFEEAFTVVNIYDVDSSVILTGVTGSFGRI